MFAGAGNAADQANRVANYLSDYEHHLSHGRRIGVEDLRPLDVRIAFGHEQSKELDDVLTRLWLAMDHTLSGTDSYKIFENNMGQGLFSKATVEVVNRRPS